VRNLFGLNRNATRVWRSTQFLVRLLALVMGSLAFSMVLTVTEPPGPGLEVASALYLGAAQSLADGHGYRVPMAGWSDPDSSVIPEKLPPGFPIAVALPTYFGLPAAQAARLVEALSAFVAMTVLLAVVGDAAGAGVALLLGLALLVMPIMVDLHLSALSGPLFLALLALTLAVMVAAPEAAAVAGLCAALAFGVRYTGAAFVLAVPVWMLLRGERRAVRVRRAVAALIPGVVLGAVWMWRVRVAPSQLGGADALAGLGAAAGIVPTNASVGGVVRGALAWLAPGVPGRGWVWVPAMVVAALALLALVVGARRVSRLYRLIPRDAPVQSSTHIPQLMAGRVLGAAGLLAAFYLAALVVQAAMGSVVPLDDRAMAPFVLLLSTGVAVAAGTWARSAPRLARVAMVVVVVVWSAASLAVSHARVRDALANGSGLASDTWRGSQLFGWVRGDGASGPLYTNWPSAAWLELGRPVRGIPVSGDAATLRAFGDTLAARGGGGVVLAFRASSPAFVNTDSLIRALDLRVLAEYPDGRVLGPPRR
jgi:hypothetical protein